MIFYYGLVGWGDSFNIVAIPGTKDANKKILEIKLKWKIQGTCSRKSFLHSGIVFAK